MVIFLVGCSLSSYQTELNASKDNLTSTTLSPTTLSPTTLPPQIQIEITEITQNQYTPSLPKFLSNISTNDNSTSVFFVTTDGIENGDGGMNDPWDLDSALLDSSRVEPGDTIWVRGGTYHPVKEPSKYNIKISGSEEAPVIIRAYPGERVTIDGGIQIHTPNVVFWGFEVFSSDLNRVSKESGSHPSDLNRPGGVAAYSNNVALINNIIHDGENGITAQINSENAVIYGNISYNNGWLGPDRGHGHGLYGQNEVGSKYIFENIIFNNFGEYSYHIYREDGPLKNITFYGNVALNDTFLVGGIQPASNMVLLENYIYNASTRLGFKSFDNGNITVVKNYFWNTFSTALEVKWWKDANIIGNRIYSDKTLTLLQFPRTFNNFNWDKNYYFSENNRPFHLTNSNLTYNTWKQLTRFDANSYYYSTFPDEQAIIIRPNSFEEKRGHIIVFNWSKKDSVSVDITSLGLEVGDSYTIHNAQNFYEETIDGTYDGKPVIIPMNGWTVAKPIGWDEPLGDVSFPDFGTFVLIATP